MASSWMLPASPAHTACGCGYSHEEETQWNDCIVNAMVDAKMCGNLTTAAQIKQNCGSPIASNNSICPVRPGPAAVSL